MESQPPKRERDEESEPDELDLLKIVALRCQPEATSNGATKTEACVSSYQGSTDAEDPGPCRKGTQTGASTDTNPPFKHTPENKNQPSVPQTANVGMGTNAKENMANEAASQSNGDTKPGAKADMNSPSKPPPKDKNQLSEPQTANIDMGTKENSANEASLESNGEEQFPANCSPTYRYQEPMVGAYAVAPPPDQSTIEENQDDESESDEESAVTPHTSAAARLAVAIPVDENHERQAQSLPKAEEYNLDEQARMRTERKRKTHLIKATICISLGALILAGFVLLIVYLLGLDEKVDQQEAHDGNTSHAFTSHNTTSNEIEAYVMAL
ncbi:expressed unknown protein (Partial), partial [Seminavis robusta]|eukprot:Sro155_g070590.1 n/a (326) ;mRNA; f:104031-105009